MVENKALAASNRQTFAVLPNDRIIYIREGDTALRDRLVVRQNWKALLARQPN
jgi:hypothetical protein